MSLVMSASAPLTSSSSTAPTAASAASTPFIAYDLRDGSNSFASLAAGTVELNLALRIDKLREAVFAAARALLPERYSYLALDVYPPGSSDLGASVPARPRDSIASVLAKATVADDDTLIIVARPLPSTAGVQGERQATAVQTNPLSSLPSVYTHPSLFHCHLLCSMFCSELTNRAGSRHGEDHKRNRRTEGYGGEDGGKAGCGDGEGGCGDGEGGCGDGRAGGDQEGLA